MRPRDVWGGATPSTAAVLEMADGLRGHDPHLAAALVEHAIRLGGDDPSVRHAADLTSARALAERDAPAELALRYAPRLTAAQEDGRAADEVAWRVLLASAALELSDAQIARDLLADVDEDAVPGWCRAALGVLRAQERAVAGDVEGCDAVARTVGPGRGAALDLLRARAGARAVSGDVGGALELLAAATNDPAPTEPDADGGRRATALVADHVALLLDRGDVRAALDLAGPYLEAAPGPATAVAIGRLADDVARRIHLPAGDGERAMALAARVENDLTARGRPAAAARTGLVLAEAAETAGDLPQALSALRRAHAHELDARDAGHAAIRSLAAVAGSGAGAAAARARSGPERDPASPVLPGTPDAGPRSGGPHARSAADPFPTDDTGASSAARPADVEHRLGRTENAQRPGRDGPDGEQGTSGGPGEPAAPAAGGRRRRQGEDLGTADPATGPGAVGGRHGRSDEASPVVATRTDSAPSGSEGGLDSGSRSSVEDGPSPRGTAPLDDLPLEAPPRNATTTEAPSRRGEEPATLPEPGRDGANEDDPGWRVGAPADGRSTHEGEMSALDTLHRNALRLEILLGRAGGTGAPGSDGVREPDGASAPVGATSAAATDDVRVVGAERPRVDVAGADGLTSDSPSGPPLDRAPDPDPDDELPLTLVDLLAEYDLPDVRPAATRSTRAPVSEHRPADLPSRSRRATTGPSTAGDGDNPRDGRETTGRGPSAVSSGPPAKDGPRSGVGVGPTGRGRSDATPVAGVGDDRPGAVRGSTTRRADVDGAEADPGARLADLLAEAMDAFRRTEPRSNQPTSVPTGTGDGRSPR